MKSMRAPTMRSAALSLLIRPANANHRRCASMRCQRKMARRCVTGPSIGLRSLRVRSLAARITNRYDRRPTPFPSALCGMRTRLSPQAGQPTHLRGVVLLCAGESAPSPTRRGPRSHAPGMLGVSSVAPVELLRDGGSRHALLSGVSATERGSGTATAPRAGASPALCQTAARVPFMWWETGVWDGGRSGGRVVSRPRPKNHPTGAPRVG